MTWYFRVEISDHDSLRKGVVVRETRLFALSAEEFPTYLAASEAAILWGFAYGYPTRCVEDI